MSPKLGVRCLKCNTDIWASPLVMQYCVCNSVSISINQGSPIVGKRKGTPYQLLREEPDGKLIISEPMDTSRVPIGDPSLNMSKAERHHLKIIEE